MSRESRDQVPAGQPPRRVTIVDVARHAGVSTASASKVLRNAYGVSGDMQTRVRASMSALGYRPHRLARGMRGHTYTVGMMVSDIENPFFHLLAGGIVEVLAAADYELLIAPAGPSAANQDSMMDALIDHHMDGVILVAPRGTDSQLERVGSEIPVVAIGRHSPLDQVDTVSGDERRGAALIVGHLADLGHTDIAFITNQQMDNNLPQLPENARMRHYKDAMRQRGLGDRSRLISGQWSIAGGGLAAREFLSLAERPTAIHAGADVAALGLIDHLSKQGVATPDEVSVVGYDNSPMAALAPFSLTSVDVSGHEMGRTAALLLLERIGGRKASQHELTHPTLKIRATTSSPGNRQR